MSRKSGEYESKIILQTAKAGRSGTKETTWAEAVERTSLQKQDNDKPKKPQGPPVEDDDYEDGDIAKPKHDRHGNDDEPL